MGLFIWDRPSVPSGSSAWIANVIREAVARESG